MNTDTSKRLSEALAALNINQAEAAERLGVTPSNLSQILRGNRALGKNMLKRIESTFPISQDWLLTGEGEMLTAGTVTESAPEPPQAEPLELVPLIPIGALAGEVQGFSADGVSLVQCEKVVSPVPGCDIAIDVSGRSMEPDFPNGCRVFCKRIYESAFIAWGNVFVIDTCNGAFIKRVFPSTDPGAVEARSINPEFPAFDIPKPSIYGMYRVLMMARGYSAS